MNHDAVENLFGIDGYKIAGFAGAAMSTLAVCIPSFFVIYGISLFFDQFLSLRWVSCAFRGFRYV